MKIGVICPSEIAFRRFMPALKCVDDIEFIGIGINSVEERFGPNLPSKDVINNMLNDEKTKANNFIENYGGKIFDSYLSVVTSNEIDAVYIPLPPALHYKWAKKALENGKHVLVEKPATISYNDTKELLEIANKNSLAIHENYMFNFHKQLDEIDEIIKSGELGDVRLYRISFGFPRRSINDFRYNKMLGGGSLIDAGGYTLKYATRLLGNTSEIKFAQLNYIDDFDVDIYGSAVLVNQAGTTAQVAFGMDNDYKCELEIWGSKGTLHTGRVLTAPAGFIPSISIKNNTEIKTRSLSSDDSFKKSIEFFINCTKNEELRSKSYSDILKQSQLIDCFMKMSH